MYPLLIAISLSVIIGALWLARVPLLIGMTNLWVVSDPLQRADAIIVLGGGAATRPFAAAELFRRGYASRVVFFDTQPQPEQERENTPKDADVYRNALLKEGVPPEALILIGRNVSSTREESLAVRDWIQTTGSKTIIIPTEFPHTRRTRWTFNRALAGTDTRSLVYAINGFRYDRTNWWHHKDGLDTFKNECLKYLYYILRY